MPWGLTRFHHSGQSHFVTFCCYHRHRLFTADPSCRIFESALERVRRSYSLYLYGYVVMPEHVHLLLSEPQRDTFSRRTAPLKPKPGLSGPPASQVGFSRSGLLYQQQSEVKQKLNPTYYFLDSLKSRGAHLDTGWPVGRLNGEV